MQTNIGDRGAELRHGFPVVIASMPANARQRKIAFVTLIVLSVSIVITLPFESIRLGRVDAFLPITQTVMFIADLLTSVLLFAQYSVYPHRGVLALADGYLFSGLFAFLHTLAFPGAYESAAVIGDGLNSAGLLFVTWHTAFPLSVIVYTLLKDRRDIADRPGRATGVIIGITITCVATATAGLAWVATTGVGYLPSLYETATLSWARHVLESYDSGQGMLRGSILEEHLTGDLCASR